jgi:hypothetical protein
MTWHRVSARGGEKLSRASGDALGRTPVPYGQGVASSRAASDASAISRLPVSLMPA